MDRELVLPADFGDYAWEVESKGYFSEASVRIGGLLVGVSFYEPARLTQDITEELAAGRPFATSRLLVLERVLRTVGGADLCRTHEPIFGTSSQLGS